MKHSTPFLVPKRRRGRLLYYWQPSATLAKSGWKSMPLGPDLQTAIEAARKENEKVEAWKNGGAAPREVRKLIRKGTMVDLITAYRAAMATRVSRGEMRASTEREYNSKLRTIEKWSTLGKIGSVPIAAIDRARVRKLRDALMQPVDGVVRHTSAHATLRVLRTLMQFGIDEGMLPSEVNPAARPGLSTPPPRDQIWSRDATEAFIAVAASQGYASVGLAVELAGELGIGQREKDILSLTVGQWVDLPPHKVGGHAVWKTLAEPDATGTLAVKGFRLRQGKTKRWVEVPVVGVTRHRVEAAIAAARTAGALALLVEEGRGTPWDQTRFQRRVLEVRREAAGQVPELLDLEFRDLRRTAVVYLGELGIEDHLIAAITQHSLDTTKRILETYMPRTTAMAGRAIALRVERTPKPDEQEQRA